MLRSLPTGVRLNVVEEGDGPPVVFLHGLGATVERWNSQLDELSDTYRCVAVDLRGHGMSDRTSGDYSIGMFARDVAEVCGLLDIDRAAFVGISMGGIVTQALALDHGPLVKTMTLIGTTGAAASPEAREVFPVLFRTIREEGVEAFLVAQQDNIWAARTLAERPRYVRAFNRKYGGNDPDVFVRSAEAASVFHSLDRIGAVDVPTLVIHGAEDTFVAVANSEALAAAIPGSELVLLPDCGHPVPDEQPDELNRLLRDFLGKHA